MSNKEKIQKAKTRVDNDSLKILMKPTEKGDAFPLDEISPSRIIIIMLKLRLKT